MKLEFPPIRQPLYLGCTLGRHRYLGIDAVVNARGGQQWRNEISREETEMERDARRVHAWLERRIRFYQFGSRCFRRQPHLARLLSDPGDF